MTSSEKRVTALARRYTDDMVRFLRDLIAIPSESGDERAVVARIADEMERVGFDEVRIDGLGNVLARANNQEGRPLEIAQPVQGNVAAILVQCGKGRFPYSLVARLE